jgi:hypothetical protein
VEVSDEIIFDNRDEIFLGQSIRTSTIIIFLVQPISPPEEQRLQSTKFPVVDQPPEGYSERLDRYINVCKRLGRPCRDTRCARGDPFSSRLSTPRSTVRRVTSIDTAWQNLSKTVGTAEVFQGQHHARSGQAAMAARAERKVISTMSVSVSVLIRRRGHIVYS